MQTIQNTAELEAIYGEAVPASLTKVVDRMHPLYRDWIQDSRFVVISTGQTVSDEYRLIDWCGIGLFF